MTKIPDEPITSFDISDEPLSYREVFQDMINSALKLQEEFPEGSVIYEQYQRFIDVGAWLLEFIVD